MEGDTKADLASLDKERRGTLAPLSEGSRLEPFVSISSLPREWRGHCYCRLTVLWEERPHASLHFSFTLSVPFKMKALPQSSTMDPSLFCHPFLGSGVIPAYLPCSLEKAKGILLLRLHTSHPFEEGAASLSSGIRTAPFTFTYFSYGVE